MRRPPMKLGFITACLPSGRCPSSAPGPRPRATRPWRSRPGPTSATGRSPPPTWPSSGSAPPRPTPPGRCSTSTASSCRRSPTTTTTSTPTPPSGPRSTTTCAAASTPPPCSGARRSARSSGRDPDRSRSPTTCRDAEEVFRPLVDHAGEQGVKLIVENCVMEGWHPDGYPGNLAYSPELWEWMFDLGLYLNYDPSHLVWMGIDPVEAVRPYIDRIPHAQAKDIQVDPAARNRYGWPGKAVDRDDPWDVGWWRYRVPGLGQVDWVRLVDALYEGGFDGVLSVEHEDPVWGGTEDEGRDRPADRPPDPAAAAGGVMTEGAAARRCSRCGASPRRSSARSCSTASTSTARAGEVHAVVGENGAGKSTLMKVLAGRPPAGRRHDRDRRRARAVPPPGARPRPAGVAIIYQEFNLLPERTVAENVFVGREPGRLGLVDRRPHGRRHRSAARRARRAVVRAPHAGRHACRWPSSRSSRSSRRGRSTPASWSWTSPPPPWPTTRSSSCSRLVRRLRERGLGVLYISHRLARGLRPGRPHHRAQGRPPGRHRRHRATRRRRAGHGRWSAASSTHYFPARAAPDGARRRCGCAVRGGGNARARRHRPRGAGRRDRRRRRPAGRRAHRAGPGALRRRPVHRAARSRSTARPAGCARPGPASRAGIGFVTEDRKAEGLAARPVGARQRPARRAGPARPAAAARPRRDRVEGLAPSTELRAAQPRPGGPLPVRRQPAEGRAGQVAGARARVLLFDEPTRGIDVGAKAAIHELMRELAREGAAVLMISSELPELIGMSDRIVVHARGPRSPASCPAGATEEEVDRPGRRRTTRRRGGVTGAGAASGATGRSAAHAHLARRSVAHRRWRVGWAGRALDGGDVLHQRQPRRASCSGRVAARASWPSARPW